LAEYKAGPPRSISGLTFWPLRARLISVSHQNKNVQFKLTKPLRGRTCTREFPSTLYMTERSLERSVKPTGDKRYTIYFFERIYCPRLHIFFLLYNETAFQTAILAANRFIYGGWPVFWSDQPGDYR